MGLPDLIDVDGLSCVLNLEDIPDLQGLEGLGVAGMLKILSKSTDFYFFPHMDRIKSKRFCQSTFGSKSRFIYPYHIWISKLGKN